MNAWIRRGDPNRCIGHRIEGLQHSNTSGPCRTSDLEMAYAPLDGQQEKRGISNSFERQQEFCVVRARWRLAEAR